MSTAPTLRERLTTLGTLSGRLRGFGVQGRRGDTGRGFMKLRSRTGRTHELLLVPQDPRTPDPSFGHELALGQLGLAGTVVDLAGHSPFTVPPPSEAWSAELQGFGWLRHLSATASERDRAAAQRLVGDWVSGKSFDAASQRIGRRPDVTGRRVIAWLTNSNLLLDDAAPDFYRGVMHAFSDAILMLERSLRRRAVGSQRITAAAALTLASLSLAGQDKRLHRAEATLLAELGRQVLPDGGHESRNPALVLDLLLDLMPLRHCYHARKMTPPPALLDTTQRMVTFINHVRLGDGSLARFNGTGRIETDALATILSIDQRLGDAGPMCGPSGFARLSQATTTLVMDCGRPVGTFDEAFAGSLAFEMTDGSERLVSNGGRPHNAPQSIQALARAAASHSTLVLAAASPQRIANIKYCVDAAVDASTPGALTLSAEHNGYLSTYGLLHKRRVTLSADGSRLDVIDTLAPPSGDLRTARDLPFAVHIHLAPETRVQSALSGCEATITLASGRVWKLIVEGARAYIEPGRDFSHLLGVVVSRQIVLRGATYGASTITWSLTRQPMEPAA